MKILSYLVTAILVILGMYYMFLGKVQADDYEYRFAKRIFTYDGHKTPPSREQIAKWQAEYDFHHFHAVRTFNEAKDLCWYIPNVSDREKAKYCFTAAIASVGNSTPSMKLVATVTSLFLQYGLDAMNEWNAIQTKLHWSNYHFELCDHYSSLIHR